MDNRVPSNLRRARCLGAAERVGREAAARAPGLDVDGAFPVADVEALAREGLLEAPVPEEFGGPGLGFEPDAGDLCRVLRLVGRGSLPLGRIYEGHVNALQLVARYGDLGQQRRWFADALDGHLFGVWNTEAPATGLTFQVEGGTVRLKGGKTYASGAGFVTRGLVTGRRVAGDSPTMLIVPLEPGTRADLSEWRAHGMRASATGSIDLTGLTCAGDCILGGSDDYHRQPFFSAGAWRFTAVQVGGIEAVLDAWLDHLRASGRGDDPHQLARLGEGLVAAETARLWVERAAARVAAGLEDGPAIVAYVNLARLAVERAGLDVLQLAQRSVGLQGFLRAHPMERLSRDLATYLRQPAPDRALTLAAAHVVSGGGSAGELLAFAGGVSMKAADWLAAAERLPFGDLDTIVDGTKPGIVVVAPHPDDESLGCGGLIAKACEAGRSVRLVVVSDGVGSHPNSRAFPPDRLRALRERETVEAAACLGLRPDQIVFMRLPDRFVPSAGPDAEAAADTIANMVVETEAGLLAVTWRHDPHCDHAAAAAIVDIARARLSGVRVCHYPVWGWSLPPDAEVGRAPTGWRIDVAAQSASKTRAVAAHRSQVTDLIGDDPRGFRLDPAMLARFARPFEILVEATA